MRYLVEFILANVLDATSMFDASEIEHNSKTRFKSREKLISMKIDDFLKMVPPSKGSKLKEINDLISKGIKFSDLPFLQIENHGKTAKVVGHEGRHRALALRKQGFTSIPVLIISTSGEIIRWSEQTNPSRFDYLEEWPLVLISENNSTTIPFPISREMSNQDYSA